MNEKQLGDALLRWASTGPALTDPQQLVDRVLRRDRRRVRILAAVTVLLWVIAAGGIPLFFALFMAFIFPKADDVVREMITHRRGGDPQQLASAAHAVLLAIAKLSVVLVTGSVLALLLAAVGTVMLVFAARRATLRQVNANLTAIAERMRKDPQGRPPGPEAGGAEPS